MSKIETFRELGQEERIAAFEAAALLLVARILVTIVPLRSWRGRFGSVGDSGSHKGTGAQADQHAQLVRQAIKRAMRNAPLDYICLPQALAARWMLERRGVQCELNIGARRGESGETELHAWLTHAGACVTGDCDPADFALLRRPTD